MIQNQKKYSEQDIALLEAAMGEFKKHGKVLTLKCDLCRGVKARWAKAKAAGKKSL